MNSKQFVRLPCFFKLFSEGVVVSRLRGHWFGHGKDRRTHLHALRKDRLERKAFLEEQTDWGTLCDKLDEF